MLLMISRNISDAAPATGFILDNFVYTNKAPSAAIIQINRLLKIWSSVRYYKVVVPTKKLEVRYAASNGLARLLPDGIE